MPISCRIAALLAAIALCAPAAATGQTTTIPQTGGGVSTQPPVPLDDGERKRDPTPRAPARPATAAAASELPNTGSDPRLLFLVGAALSLLGVGLRLRTADAELY